MTPLGAPPADLRDFPVATVAAGTPLLRVHRELNHPWWFSRDGSGRFDLVNLPEGQGGTCYLAETELGGFLEVFRDLALIARAEADGRRVSTLVLDEQLRLADCTTSEARQFGVTAAIHSTDDYDLTHAWARAWALEGFHGVRYRI